MTKQVPLALLISSVLCFAQSDRGSIRGAVTDPSGSAVPNATVRVTNASTNATANVSTTSAGDYNAANLASGAYRIEVSVDGFKSLTIEGITLTAGGTVRADARLELGGITQTIEVQAQSVAVQTEDARSSTSVSNALVDRLPLVVGGAMRSPFDLVTTVPEARGGANLSLGGGQGGAFAATFDGISVNTNRQGNTTETSYLTPSLEAITEFAVDTNGFKAEYGQAGGGVISFASKSGTNEVHGSAYDFIRNDYVDARNFFAANKGIYRQNDFGGSLGGPVLIPKLYNGKNRTFFFTSFEGFRNSQGQSGTILSVPTREMYQGDFQNLVNSRNQPLVIYDPATTRANPSGTGFIRDPFQNNVIPAARLSAVSKQFIGLAQGAMLPNRPGLVPGTIGYISNNFVSTGGSSHESTNKASVKIDHLLGNNHRVSYLFNRTWDLLNPGASGPAGLPVPFNSFQSSTFTADLHRATYDWTISPRMVNQLSFGVNRFNKDSYSVNVGGNWKSKVCILNAVDCNVNFGNVAFTEFAGWGGLADNGTEQPRWTIKDDFNYTLGSHSLKFGGTYDHQEANGFGQQNIAGLGRFSFLETAVPGSTSATSGSSFASFLLGHADSGATETIRYLRQIYRYYGFYAQDDWRVNSKLVINYGVRYEFTLPPVSDGDKYSDFSPTTPNPAVNNYLGALVFAGSGPGRQGVRSLIPGYYGGFSPRLSLARTFGKSVVRMGIGRSFGRVTVLQSSSHYSGFIGQYSFASTDQGITPAFTWDQGLPAYPLPPQINPAFSNNNNVDYWNGRESTRPAEYYNWTFSVQRPLAANLTLDVDYNAAVGSHLNASLMNINQVPMNTVNALIAKYGASQAISLLNSNITSSAAVAAGFQPPYANFTNPAVQVSRSVSQSLRAFPQFLEVDTRTGGGDRSGHSTYHAGILKLNYRASKLVTFQGSYSFSKILTNADNFSGSGRSQDAGNLGLEKSIGAFDQTHVVKLNTVFDLPFGQGHAWINKGWLSQVAGGWRIGAIQSYASGFPLGVTSNGSLPIFNGANRPLVSTYAWRAPIAGESFDPGKDKFLDPAAFPAQPLGIIGNAPRLNSQARMFPSLNENVSLAKTFRLTERFRLDLRAEAFNVFNRVVFGAPTTSINSQTFGVIASQSNSPRQMQGALKLYW